MDTQIKQKLASSVREFRMPRYHEIPDVGLYLEQTVKFINHRLSPLQGAAITGSMVGNYVKKGLVSSPVNKHYSREQIAYLIFIALAKNVLSLDNLIRLIDIQKRSYTAQTAYNYLCDEMENILAYVFGLKDTVEDVGSESTEEKQMLRTTIIAAAHKIYLDKYFEHLAAGNQP